MNKAADSQRWFFLKRFLAHPGRVGAILPSGPALCQAIAGNLAPDCDRAVAELGPGTGVITREILKQGGSGMKFFAVELDPEIHQRLQRKLPEVKILCENAVHLPELCQKMDMPGLNVVISGLPFATFPQALQQDILQAVKNSLLEGGRFYTFAYLQGMLLPAGLRFRKLLKKNFSVVTVSPVIWNNVPPAVIYCCKL